MKIFSIDIKSIAAIGLILISTIACNQEPVAKPEYTLEGNVYKNDIFTYEGDIRNGHPNGKGVITFKWGDKYNGEVVNGVPEGQGVMTYVDGSVYEGQFKGGQHNGFGRIELTNGNWYEGDWKNGSRHGKGILMADGIRQSGIFENDQPKKVSILNLRNCLKGDCRSGYGEERTSEGIYAGYFTGGEFNGQGTYKYNNGDVYKGSFINGQKHGAGVLSSSAGKYVIKGIFEKNKWVEGSKEYSDGTPPLILIRSIL